MKHKVKVFSGTKTSLPVSPRGAKATVGESARRSAGDSAVAPDWAGCQLWWQNTPACHLRMSLIEQWSTCLFNNAGNDLGRSTWAGYQHTTAVCKINPHELVCTVGWSSPFVRGASLLRKRMADRQKNVFRTGYLVDIFSRTNKVSLSLQGK